MPQPRMDIRMIKDILRLKYSGGLSHEAIARNLGLSKGVVAKYLSLAGAAGLDWQTTAELDESALERRLLGRSEIETRVVRRASRGLSPLSCSQRLFIFALQMRLNDRVALRIEGDCADRRPVACAA